MASTHYSIALAEHGRTTRTALTATLDRLLVGTPRLVRFGFVGGTCALLQLLFLDLLVRANVELHLANAVGFLISTQLNFALSSLITWRDRPAARGSLPALARRLAGYNALALASLAVNQLVFTIAVAGSHYLMAAILGILAGMLLTYAISGGVIFRRTSPA